MQTMGDDEASCRGPSDPGADQGVRAQSRLPLPGRHLVRLVCVVGFTGVMMSFQAVAPGLPSEFRRPGESAPPADAEVLIQSALAIALGLALVLTFTFPLRTASPPGPRSSARVIFVIAFGLYAFSCVLPVVGGIPKAGETRDSGRWSWDRSCSSWRRRRSAPGSRTSSASRA